MLKSAGWQLPSLVAIVGALAQAEVRYLIVGGIAVAAYGHARVTFDLDLVLELERDNALRAIDALSSLGYQPLLPVGAAEFADPTKRSAWIRDKGMKVFQLHSSGYKDMRVDLFVEEPFDFDQEYDAATMYDLSAQLAMRVIRLDILIEMKRKAARPKDLADLAFLTRIRGEAESP
jgi:hypothetical protein